MRAGQWRDARVLLEKVCQKDTNDADVLRALATVYGHLGHMDGVVGCCQAVLRLRPRDASTMAMLASALGAQGQYKEAMHYFGAALDVAPDDPVVLNNLGQLQLIGGQWEQAVRTLSKAVGLKTGYIAAHCNLATAFRRLDRDIDAINQYQLVLHINPESYPAAYGLGELFLQQGNLWEAEKHFRLAVRLGPDNIDAWHGLGQVLGFMGRLDEALGICRTILEKKPGDPQTISEQAEYYQRMGDSDRAYGCVSQLQQSENITPVAASVFSRICHRYDACDDALEMCRTQLAMHSQNMGMQQLLSYAAGHLCDRMGDYNKAFEYFRRANELSPAPFDKTAFHEEISRTIEIFSPEKMPGYARSGNVSQRPVFVVGMPRTGTSLVEQILSSHPEVYGAGELNAVNNIVASIDQGAKNGYPAGISSLETEDMDRLAERYHQQLEQLSGSAMRVIDKMPHNFRHLGLISLLFPGAAVIHCTRDPLDTCLSIYFQSFNAAHPYATRLENLGAYYQEYQRLMSHWCQVLDIPVYAFSYERLVSEQEPVTRELLGFCGLGWDARCLEFYRYDRNMATASYDQVRKPLYQQAVCRWKHYEAYLEPLKQALA